MSLRLAGRFVIAVLVSVLTLAGSARAQSGAPFRSLSDIQSSGVIRIGVFADRVPLGYRDDDGRYHGYEVAFARRIARDLLGDENRAVFVPVQAASRADALRANAVDVVIANYTVKPDREEQVDFALPYMKTALGVVSPQSAPIRDVSQLKGKSVIVVMGTTAEAYFLEHHPDIRPLRFKTIGDAFQALKDGRGAALCHDNTVLFVWSRDNAGFVTAIDVLGPQDLNAPAVASGNMSLRQWLDEEITRLGRERFFHKAYDATLKPFYGVTVNPESVVIEGGRVD